MKEAMRSVDPVRGIHYRDLRDPNQIALDVSVSHLEPLQAIVRQLGSGERTLESLGNTRWWKPSIGRRTPRRPSRP
jgi:hypothetical protein